MNPLMKKSLFFILLFFVVACSNNSLSGNKFYLLNAQVSGYSATLHEYELNFLNDEKIEVRVTLYGFLDELKTYKTDPPVDSVAKIYDYNYKDGFLEIPDLKINVQLNRAADGTYTSNTNEVLYTNSIVEILKTDEAKKRVVMASPMHSLDDMFLKMLQSGTGMRVVEKNGRFVIENSNNSLDTGTKTTITKQKSRKVDSIPIVIKDLPNPRQIDHAQGLTFKTKESKSAIIDFYQSYGENIVDDNSFYLSSEPGSGDSCILVQIKDEGIFNRVEISWQCD